MKLYQGYSSEEQYHGKAVVESADKPEKIRQFPPGTGEIQQTKQIGCNKQDQEEDSTPAVIIVLVAVVRAGAT